MFFPCHYTARLFNSSYFSRWRSDNSALPTPSKNNQYQVKQVQPNLLLFPGIQGKEKKNRTKKKKKSPSGLLFLDNFRLFPKYSGTVMGPRKILGNLLSFFIRKKTLVKLSLAGFAVISGFGLKFNFLIQINTIIPEISRKYKTGAHDP